MFGAPDAMVESGLFCQSTISAQDTVTKILNVIVEFGFYCPSTIVALTIVTGALYVMVESQLYCPSKILATYYCIITKIYYYLMLRDYILCIFAVQCNG